jgi:hypothetical protein
MVALVSVMTLPLLASGRIYTPFEKALDWLERRWPSDPGSPFLVTSEDVPTAEEAGRPVAVLSDLHARVAVPRRKVPNVRDDCEPGDRGLVAGR